MRPRHRASSKSPTPKLIQSTGDPVHPEATLLNVLRVSYPSTHPGTHPTTTPPVGKTTLNVHKILHPSTHPLTHPTIIHPWARLTWRLGFVAAATLDVLKVLALPGLQREKLRVGALHDVAAVVGVHDGVGTDGAVEVPGAVVRVGEQPTPSVAAPYLGVEGAGTSAS